jgi:3-dehydroquinate synthase
MVLKPMGKRGDQVRLKITLPQEAGITEILFCTDLLTSDLSFLPKGISRFVIVTDSITEKLIGQSLQKKMERLGLEVDLFSFPQGEAQKTRETKQRLEDQMLEAHLGRDCCLLAIGGGVVSDVGGFLAATYCRGIPYLIIPTTLLGMVDAALGGKTGVNTPHGKNLIGAFYSPKAVVIDPSLLKTLPENEWRNGSAEIIKHGLIRDAAFFDLLSRPFSRNDLAKLTEIIAKSCAIKIAVTEADPKESGVRRTLNFGHTIGHALEKIEGYALAHGEAVAIGMLVEGFISVQMGYLSAAELNRIKETIKAYGFPLELPKKLSYEQVKESMMLDKKAKKAVPRFVLLKSIGEALSFGGEYCTAVDEALLRAATDWMQEKGGLL